MKYLLGISKNLKKIVIASRSLAKQSRFFLLIERLSQGDPFGTSVASLPRNDDNVFRDALFLNSIPAAVHRRDFFFLQCVETAEEE